MAEVDLLGLHFDAALRPRTLVGECKDRKGGAKEADRVVWLLGLARMLGAGEILFAKTRLADGTFQFARPYALHLWDEPAVRDVEQRLDLPAKDGFFGSGEVAMRETVLIPGRSSGALRGLPLRTAWEYLAGPFWYAANPSRLKRLALYFDALNESSLGDVTVRSSFVAEGLTALLACVGTTAGELTRTSPARADAWQEDTFAAGAADARTLRDIAGRADDFYHDALARLTRSGGPQGAVALELPRLADAIAQPPQWLSAYLALARTVGSSLNTATDALRYADIVLFDEHLAGVDPEPALALVFGGVRQDLRRVVELAGLFLERVWGVSDPLLDALLRRTGKGTMPNPKVGQGQLATESNARPEASWQTSPKPIDAPPDGTTAETGGRKRAATDVEGTPRAEADSPAKRPSRGANGPGSEERQPEARRETPRAPQGSLLEGEAGRGGSFRR